MRNIYVKFYDPSMVFPDEIIPELTDKQIIDACFRVYKYKDEASALMAYANTMCTWSTLLKDSVDINKWIREAYDHIKNCDYNWLEEHFV